MPGMRRLTSSTIRTIVSSDNISLRANTSNAITNMVATVKGVIKSLTGTVTKEATTNSSTNTTTIAVEAAINALAAVIMGTRAIITTMRNKPSLEV